MASQVPVLASHRVTPLRTSFSLNSVAPEQPVRDIVLSKSAIALIPRPNNRKLHHFHLQWRLAAKLQLLMLRNTLGCVFIAVLANGCFYLGNVFSLKPSEKQSRPEFFMGIMVWTAFVHAAKMTMAYLPSLMTQRFLKYPDYKPSLWFCAGKLVKGTFPYFIVMLIGMIGVGLLVQNTSLMHEHFKYKLHFYFANLWNLVFTTGIALVARKIYFEETYQGHERRSALNDISEPRQAVRSPSKAENSPPRTPHRPPNYRSTNFWGEYKVQATKAFQVAMCGGFVHVVSWFGILNRGTVVIMGFTMFGICTKLAFQEAARHYILKKRIRSIRTMCVLVGLPTVLIDTQSRIVLLGTQTNTFLVAGTFAMAVAEICLRVGKTVFVSSTIRRRANELEQKLQELSTNNEQPRKGGLSPSSLKLEFELWRRQIISYHTAELTADMYAEYISIGCSQSIVFWWAGHPLYPALQLDTQTSYNEHDIAKWRFNQVAMLAFQFVMEIFVDYVCVVMEMAAGIDFERLESLSTFLGVIFMMMAALNINISSALYMS